MFYSLHTIWQLVLLLLGLAAFAAVVWRWPRLGAELIIFLSPLYLLKISNLPLTVLEALIWIFVLVWLAYKIKNRQGDWWPEFFYRYNRSFWLALILVLAGVFLSSLFSADWRVSFGIFKAYFVAPMIFSFILAGIFNESEGSKPVLTALLMSAAAVAAIAAVYLLFGRLTFDGRLAAFYLSPNHLAMWLAPGLIAGFGLWLEVKKTWQKVFLCLVFFLLFFVLYFTYSYGAWLGLAAAAMFILFYLWRLKLISYGQLLRVTGCIFFAFIFIVFLQLIGGNNEKLISLFSSSRSSWQSRLMIWQSAILILKEHWLLGMGPGLFQKYYLAYQQYFSVPYLEWAVPQPHNLFLAWWLQAGLAGFIGFIWLVVFFFRRALRLLLEIKSLPTLLLSAVMVYFLIHGLADATFWKNDLALIFWLIVFLGSTAARRAD